MPQFEQRLPLLPCDPDAYPGPESQDPFKVAQPPSQLPHVGDKAHPLAETRMTTTAQAQNSTRFISVIPIDG